MPTVYEPIWAGPWSHWLRHYMLMWGRMPVCLGVSVRAVWAWGCAFVCVCVSANGMGPWSSSVPCPRRLAVGYTLMFGVQADAELLSDCVGLAASFGGEYIYIGGLAVGVGVMGLVISMVGVGGWVGVALGAVWVWVWLWEWACVRDSGLGCGSLVCGECGCGFGSMVRFGPMSTVRHCYVLSHGLTQI